MASVSRVFTEVTDDKHKKLAGKLREVLDTYKQNEDLINIGAYQRGNNPDVDYAIDKIKPVMEFLKQGIFERNTFAEMTEHLQGIFPEIA